jgi:hypothetical protein
MNIINGRYDIITIAKPIKIKIKKGRKYSSISIKEKINKSINAPMMVAKKVTIKTLVINEFGCFIIYSFLSSLSSL